MAYVPIVVWKVDQSNGAFPQTERFPEKATQTGKIGIPVQFASGVVQECATIDAAATTDPILGFNTEPFNNLTTDNTPKTLTYGSVQNQSGAVLIPPGAPPNDGKIGVIVADPNIEFIAACLVTHATVVGDLGAKYGLTKDNTTGQYYIDTSITAVASGACVRITDPAPIDVLGTLGGRMAFVVLTERQQLAGVS